MYFVIILFRDIVSIIDLQLLQFKIIHYTILEVVTPCLLSEPYGIFKIKSRTKNSNENSIICFSLLTTGFAGVQLPHAASCDVTLASIDENI